MKYENLTVFDKINGVLLVIVLVIGIAAILLESPPREYSGWGPRPQEERIGGSSTRPPRTPQKWSGFRDPWQEDARRNTARWQEFLEDLDESGIMLSDPDATEIWEQDYE